MISVLLTANKKDVVFWKTFKKILCSNFSTILVGRHKLYAPKNPSLILADSTFFSKVTGEGCILVFKELCDLPKIISRSKKTVVIVNAHNKKLVQGLSKTSLHAVTCGLSNKDTLTLSSINEDSAVITLQRSIPCFDNTVAEPQEIPIKLSGTIDTFTLLSLAAIFIISGNINLLQNATI